MATSQRTRPSRRIAPGRRFDELLTGPIVKFLVMSWPARLAWIGGAGLVVAILVQAGQSLGGRSSHGGGIGSNGLPISTTERAQLFTEAWASHDTAGMLKFILPADEARLQHWIATVPVPAAVSDVKPAERKIKTISVQTDDADGAVVSVRVSSRTSSASDSRASELLVQQQMWSYASGVWHFVPETPAPDAAKPGAIWSRANSSGQAAYPTMADAPTARPASRNVVVPTLVPPWSRTR
jgi:hypothetical protein